MTDELAEHILFAHPPGNELTVLRAKIEDQDAFIFGQWRHSGLLFPYPCGVSIRGIVGGLFHVRG